MQFKLEIYNDKARLLATERRATASGKSFYDHIVWVGEAYNDQVPLLKREARKATGQAVGKCAVVKFERAMYLGGF
jgi:hypothetical protein